VVFGTGAPVAGNVGGAVAGAYGTLVLSADGSYSYTPDYSAAAVAALGPNDVLSEVFSYEITDGDGDSTTTTLTVSILGTPAIIGVSDGTTPGTDGAVLESDLSNGTNAAGTDDVLSGSFQAIAPEGVVSVTVGGTVLSAAELAALSPATPAVITTPLGTLELTSYDPASGAIGYVYTLTGATDHSGGAVSDDFTVSVTDALGDTGTGTLSVAIVDDAPV
ncbi:VCBS domain-containing protein, partial [Rhodalgimonas zhirmunskyi]